MRPEVDLPEGQAPGGPYMISVRNLVKTFDTFTAVNDVSFDVAAGEIFAFLGPT